MFTRLYLITRNSAHTVSQPPSLESPAKVKLKKIKHAEVIGPVPEGTGVHLMFLSPCSSSSRCRGRGRRRRSRAHDAIHGNSIHLMRRRRDNERRAKVVHDSTCPQQRRRSEIEMPRGLVSGAILPDPHWPSPLPPGLTRGTVLQKRCQEQRCHWLMTDVKTFQKPAVGRRLTSGTVGTVQSDVGSSSCLWETNDRDGRRVWIRARVTNV